MNVPRTENKCSYSYSCPFRKEDSPNCTVPKVEKLSHISVYSESILLGRMHLTALSQNGKTLLCICVLWIYPFRKGMHLTAHCPKSGKTLSYICVLWIYPFRKGMHPHYTVPKVEKLSHISVHSEFILLGRMHLTILYTVPKEVILPVSEHSVSILLGRMHLTALSQKKKNLSYFCAFWIFPDSTVPKV